MNYNVDSKSFIEGNIQKIIYQRDDFVILSILEKNTKAKEKIVAIGSFDAPERHKETPIKFFGNWEKNKKFGMQFKFDEYSLVEEDEDAMYYFLTRIIKGIPKKVAREIADHPRIESIITQTPSFLLNFDGIGEKRLETIVSSWKEYEKIRKLGTLLSPFGITRSTIIRIHREMGDDAVKKIQKNPYILTKLKGFGFKKADKMALKMGIRPDSGYRLSSALDYTVNWIMGNEGHTKIPKNLIVEKMKEITEVKDENDLIVFRMTEEDFQTGTEIALKEEKIKLFEDGDIALASHHWMETYIYERLESSRREYAYPMIQGEELERFIRYQESIMGLTFDETQKDAIRKAAQGHKIMVVGGYAGCGKTTISLAILNLYKQFAGNRVHCCALSGVAAKRIQIVTGYPSGTIHSYLRLGTEDERNEANPVEEDVVVLDEASMVDTAIFYRLLKAIDPKKTRLLLLGDPGQLPPVGAGSPYATIIEKKLAPAVILTKVHRQDDGNTIATVAASIRKGEVPSPADMGKDVTYYNFTPSNYWTIRKSGDEKRFEELKRRIDENILQKVAEVCQKIKHIYQRQFNTAIDEKGVEDLAKLITYFQIGAPMKKGVTGTMNLNLLAQSVINPPDPERKREVPIGKGENRRILREGDKILHLRNQIMEVENLGKNGASPDERYGKKKVYNGQFGFILNISKNEEGEMESMQVIFPHEGYIAFYDKNDLDEEVLDLGYAASIHKLQGGEAKIFTLVISRSHSRMLNSRLLYTAVTRAKKRLFIFAEDYPFTRGCRQKDSTRRTTVIEYLANKKEAESERRSA